MLLPLGVRYGHLHAKALRRFLFSVQRAVLIVAGHEPGVLLVSHVMLCDIDGTWGEHSLIMQGRLREQRCGSDGSETPSLSNRLLRVLFTK